ncbi:hypothetical protein EII18_10735 [Comamonadaceae bacterium OH3737_COT-264]|nr:hypothetical protein EII18_10735 [Comamonadaceae bacterium OH3737_COT-264]
MGRDYRRKRASQNRDAGGFVALPWAVLDSPAYQGLSLSARNLLFELARQYVGDNNGRLLLSLKYLRTRGLNSRDVITRGKAELIKAGLIHETVKGHRPNKASWYALTFYALDRIPGYDPGAAETFVRSAYRKNEGLRPTHGLEKPAIGPTYGLSAPAARPRIGPMEG